MLYFSNYSDPTQSFLKFWRFIVRAMRMISLAEIVLLMANTYPYDTLTLQDYWKGIGLMFIAIAIAGGLLILHQRYIYHSTEEYGRYHGMRGLVSGGSIVIFILTVILSLGVVSLFRANAAEYSALRSALEFVSMDASCQALQLIKGVADRSVHGAPLLPKTLQSLLTEIALLRRELWWISCLQFAIAHFAAIGLNVILDEREARYARSLFWD